MQTIFSRIVWKSPTKYFPSMDNFFLWLHFLLCENSTRTHHERKSDFSFSQWLTVSWGQCISNTNNKNDMHTWSIIWCESSMSTTQMTHKTYVKCLRFHLAHHKSHSFCYENLKIKKLEQNICVYTYIHRCKTALAWDSSFESNTRNVLNDMLTG